MSEQLHQDIGRHGEAIQTLKVEVSAMRADLAEIRVMLATARGGWKALLVVCGVAGSVGAAIMKGFSMLKGAG